MSDIEDALMDADEMDVVTFVDKGKEKAVEADDTQEFRDDTLPWCAC